MPDQKLSDLLAGTITDTTNFYGTNDPGVNQNKFSGLAFKIFLHDGFTAGSILFSNGTGFAQDNANLFYNDANNFLGLSTNVPTHTLTLGMTGTGYADYRTADQTTNYERGKLGWSGTTFELGIENGGTGVNRSLRLRSSNRTFNIVDSGGPSGFYQFVSSTGGANNSIVGVGATMTASSGVNNYINISPVINQSGTAGYTGLAVNVTETATGSGPKRFFSGTVGGADRWAVESTGATLLAGSAGTAGQVYTSGGPNAAPSWTTPSGGGGGSPGGSTNQIQFNNAGAFAGASNSSIENGFIRLENTLLPTTVAANGLNIFRNNVSGRQMLGYVGPSGLDTTCQPHVGRNRFSQVSALGNATTVSTINSNALTVTGTATTANITTANRHTRTRRVEYLVTTAAVGAIASARLASNFWTIGNGTDGGFHKIFRIGPATGGAPTNNGFFGMHTNTGITAVDPSSLTNIIGVGYDIADTNWQIMFNDGSGLATKVDTGLPKPLAADDRVGFYEVGIFCPPSGGAHVQIINLVTGASFIHFSNTNIPAAGAYIAPKGYMTTGTTSGIIGFAFMSLYIETDF